MKLYQWQGFDAIMKSPPCEDPVLDHGSKTKIVVAGPVHREVLEYLSLHGDVVVNSGEEPWSRAALIEHCQDAAALIAFMPESIDYNFLAACPQLRIVACALKGYDNFDVAAFDRRGVWLTIVPDLLTAPTAELAIALMISLGRRVGEGDSFVRSGAFAGWRSQFYGRSVDGSIVGIVGAGAVGKAIARRLAGFRCHLLYHDANRLTPDQEDELRLHRTSLSELRERSDFLILALPLTDKTFHLVDGDFLAAMKPGSYLINPARGSLVDEAAIVDALRAGRLAGYAADVFECEEWSRPDRPAGIHEGLLSAGNTVLTPHLGSAVDSIRREIVQEAAENVVQYLAGRRPKGAVNDPAPVCAE